MAEVHMGYTLELPPLRQIIDRSIRDTLNIFTSLLELGKKYKLQQERNYFRVFIQKLEEILPKKTKEAIIKDILNRLPERQWLISDYETIMKVFIKRIADKDVNSMDTLMKNTFQKPEEMKKFVTLFFTEVVVSSKRNREFWQDLILEEENTDKMHIYNEISLSLKEMGRISERYSKKVNRRSMEIMKYMILQALRMTRILSLLQVNKLDLAKKNSTYLRAERSEMKHNA